VSQAPSLFALSVKKKLASLLTKIVIAPIIQSELSLEQTMLYKSFTHPTNFVTLTVLLCERIDLL
jgi:hypothetical protein